MGRILVQDGRIWDGERFRYADILTENKKVICIDNNINEKADFVYHAEGKTVSAGFVDAHVHLRGISPLIFGVGAAISSFPFGVTAVADAAGVMGDRVWLDSLMVKNRVFVSADVKNNRASFEHTQKMLSKYGEKAIGIKIYFDTDTGEVYDITPLEEVVRFAESIGLIVMVHSSNSPVPMADLLAVLRKGDILTHAYHGGKNNAAEDNYRCVKEAKQRGVIIDAGFAGNVHTDFDVFKDALNFGADPNIISTDITKSSAYTRGGRYGLTMCMSIAKALGMAEEDIFSAVTSNPAKALGMDGECGYLRIGANADIAVVEYADEGFDLTDSAGNRVFSKKGYRCAMTVSDGEVVYLR